MRILPLMDFKGGRSLMAAEGKKTYATKKTIEAELSLFESELALLKKKRNQILSVGPFISPESLANASRAFIGAVKPPDQLLAPCGCLQLIAGTLSSMEYPSGMRPLVSFAQEILEVLARRREDCDEVLTKTCQIVLKDYRKVDRSEGKQDILPFFWSACAEKIDSKEQRKEVAEHAILLSKKGSRLRLAAEELLPHTSWPRPKTEVKPSVVALPSRARRKTPLQAGASFPAAAAG